MKGKVSKVDGMDRGGTYERERRKKILALGPFGGPSFHLKKFEFFFFTK